MKSIVLVLLMITLAAATASAGVIYLEGPDDRGEGAVPRATRGFGSRFFEIDVYAEDFPSLAGFLMEPTFLHDSAVLSDAFAIYYPPFEPFVPMWMPDVPSCFPIRDGRKGFGWMICGSEDARITDKTWLATVTYEYTADALPGTYTIGVNEGNTVFSDADAGELSYSVVTGSVTIAADPVPEPTAIALFGTGLAGLAGWCRRKSRE